MIGQTRRDKCLHRSDVGTASPLTILLHSMYLAILSCQKSEVFVA